MDYKLLILKFILIFSDKTRHHSGNILPVPPLFPGTSRDADITAAAGMENGL